MIATPPVEPVAAPWRRRPLDDVLADARATFDIPRGRPTILAVDGRQGSGKTTIANQLAALVPGTVIVHSDDVAWWEAFFDWAHLMANGILEPLQHGVDVDYRPHAWEARDREGSIMVPAKAPLVVIEGVGVSRRSLVPMFDGAFWVQSDHSEARRRGLERDGGSQADIDFWDEWVHEEELFLADGRPWERALAILCGTPHLADVDFDPTTEVLIGRAPPALTTERVGPGP